MEARYFSKLLDNSTIQLAEVSGEDETEVVLTPAV